MNKFDFIRFLYLYPDEIEEELLDVVNKYDCITPYFDVPIQHASSKVLKDMNRRGNKEFLIKLFKNIKSKIPNAILRTTLIVGFPGETEEDFIELKEFIQEIKFDRLGVFKYSPEEDTLSATFDNQVEEEVKERRYSEIMKLQEKISYSLSKEKIGEVQKVIIEGYDSKLKYYTGRSYAFAPDDVDGIIYIKSNNNLLEGDIINVRITSNMTHDLIGEEI
jgi:ribosomal protein S12 methylthiotransferase